MMVVDTCPNLLLLRRELLERQETMRLIFERLELLNIELQLEKHEEALVEEERWRSLHEVKPISCIFCDFNPPDQI